jgi:hypothetical protein
MLISFSFIFLLRNMNSNEINDLTFKSDRLLELGAHAQPAASIAVPGGSGQTSRPFARGLFVAAGREPLAMTSELASNFPRAC